RPHGALGTGDNDWYTPAKYIEAARHVLGKIDLDPATCRFAQTRVRAAKYYTVEDDGLRQTWQGAVWLNPPYARGLIGAFVSKLVSESMAGNVESAIMLTHNYTDTRWFQEAAQASNAICFTRGRIKFEKADGSVAAPVRGQAFFYYGKEVIRYRATCRENRR